jgi:universal stress protein A
MPQIQRVLVPVEISELGRQTIEHAAQIAERFDATLDVLHVWKPPSFGTPTAELLLWTLDYDPAQVERERVERRALEQMIATTVGRKAGRVGIRFAIGGVADSIVRAAEDGYDLIVLAAQRRSGIGARLHSSVTARVTRMAPCAVMVIHVGDEQLGAPALAEPVLGAGKAPVL